MNMDCTILSGSANTTSTNVAWVNFNGRSLLIYASANLVVVLDFESREVISTLKGHIGRVNAVIALVSSRNNQAQTQGQEQQQSSVNTLEIISADDSGNIRLWTCSSSDINEISNTTDSDIFTGMQTILSLEAKYIDIVDTIEENNAKNMLITATDIDGNCKLWCRFHESESFQLVDEHTLSRPQLAQSLYIISLQNCTSFLVAYGCVDSKIYLRLFTPNGSSYDCRQLGSLYGHEDWVVTLTSARMSDGNIMMISGSQDSKLRIWKIREVGVTEDSTSIESIQGEAYDVDDNEDDEEEDGKNSPMEDEESNVDARVKFAVTQKKCSGSSNIMYAIYLEAICVGHEDWVTSVQWIETDTTRNPSFISTSMDRNIIIWSQDQATSIWMPTTRMGDIGGDLGGCIGGNLLGFVSGILSPCKYALLSVVFGGNFHLWANEKFFRTHMNEYNTPHDSSVLDGRWEPLSFITGHFGSVTDVRWGVNGDFIITVSKDQTCRIFAPITNNENIVKDNFLSSSENSTVRWMEVSRPSIHGFDLNCVDTHDLSGHLYLAGDEKMIRVLSCPNGVWHGVNKLCNIHLVQAAATSSGYNCGVERAYLPELSLSNKAAELMNEQEQQEQAARGIASVVWNKPLLEGQLADHTLWPEVDKLYGHTNDVVCLTLSGDSKFLATACKARNTETASIFIWETTNHTRVSSLTCHESTVICLRFSPNSQLLASAGKDRSLCLHERVESAGHQVGYECAMILKGAHKRIIWDSCWGEDGCTLLTGSRDGYCKIWKVLSPPICDSFGLVCVFQYFPFAGIAVTTLDMLSAPMEDGSWRCCLGSEDGNITVCKISMPELNLIDIDVNMKVEESKASLVNDSPAPVPLQVFSSIYATVEETHKANVTQTHGSLVQKIRWRQMKGVSRDEFVSCGDDFSVRIFSMPCT